MWCRYNVFYLLIRSKMLESSPLTSPSSFMSHKSILQWPQRLNFIIQTCIRTSQFREYWNHRIGKPLYPTYVCLSNKNSKKRWDNCPEECHSTHKDYLKLTWKINNYMKYFIFIWNTGIIPLMQHAINSESYVTSLTSVYTRCIHSSRQCNIQMPKYSP